MAIVHLIEGKLPGMEPVAGGTAPTSLTSNKLSNLATATFLD